MSPMLAVECLGKRVVLLDQVGEFVAGAVGRLVSVQSGLPDTNVPYATVSFEEDDFWEENVPLRSLRRFFVRGEPD